MDIEQIDQVLIPYMEGRTEFYKMLHKLYRWALTQEELDELSADDMRELSEQLDEGLMQCGFNDMYRFLRRRNTGTRQVLATDFTRVFMGMSTYEGFSAQPYASLFVGGAHQLMGAERMAVNRVYRECAVKLDEGIDLPEDHLAFECDFLAIINQRAICALRERDVERAVELLELQERFVREHVLNWLPRFYALSRKLVETRFYRGVLRVTKGFFEDEVRAIPELVEDVRSAFECEGHVSLAG